MSTATVLAVNCKLLFKSLKQRNEIQLRSTESKHVLPSLFCLNLKLPSTFSFALHPFKGNSFIINYGSPLERSILLYTQFFLNVLRANNTQSYRAEILNELKCLLEKFHRYKINSQLRFVHYTNPFKLTSEIYIRKLKAPPHENNFCAANSISLLGRGFV